MRELRIRAEIYLKTYHAAGIASRMQPLRHKHCRRQQIHHGAQQSILQYIIHVLLNVHQLLVLIGRL